MRTGAGIPRDSARQVTLLEVAPQILIREDRDAAERVERAIVRDGVEILTGCKISQASSCSGNEKIVATERDGVQPRNCRR